MPMPFLIRSAALCSLKAAILIVAVQPACGQTVQGVRIDAQGVLRSRQVVDQPLEPDARLAAERVHVSLPKVFAELRRLTEQRLAVPESLRCLDGLVKIEQISVDPARGELILTGVAEPVDAGDPLRIRGKRTGRPVILLDDLVLALRQFGPNSRSRVFGCTLLQDEKAAERVATLQRQILRQRITDQAAIARALKETIGPLNAQYFGVPEDSRFAMTCVEADYLMKRLCLGLDRLPVTGVKSYLERSGRGHLFNRFWFVADYDPLLVSRDGLTIQIPERGLALKTSESGENQFTKNDGATQFSRDFTKAMPRLETAVPVFADLHNLTDLAVVATLIAEDDLAVKARWDMAWILDPQHYQTAKVTTPRTAETLVNIRSGRGKGVTIAGGVRMDAKAITRSRKPAEALVELPIIKPGNWSTRFRAANSQPGNRR